VREAELGRRYVDKLVKIWTVDGAERWVLIHIEVQTEREAEFPQRVYVYNYRNFDRYNRPWPPCDTCSLVLPPPAASSEQ
jgi:hypothetical protein